jgi:hypothetical protein
MKYLNRISKVYQNYSGNIGNKFITKLYSEHTGQGTTLDFHFAIQHAQKKRKTFEL